MTTRRNVTRAKKYFREELFPGEIAPALLERGLQAINDVLESSPQIVTASLQPFKESDLDAKQTRRCAATVSNWLALGQCLSYVKNTPPHSDHLDVLFDLLVQRLITVRSSLIPLRREDTVFGLKYLFAVEVATVIMADLLCESVSVAEHGNVRLDRLDTWLLGWVAISDCHHLTDPTKPFMIFATYLRATSGLSSGCRRLPGTYNRLVEGFASAARSRHTATAGIAAVACLVAAETMREEGEGDEWNKHYLERVLERSANVTADHWSLRGDSAEDKWGRISGLSVAASSLIWSPSSHVDEGQGAIVWMRENCALAGVVEGSPRATTVIEEARCLLALLKGDDVIDSEAEQAAGNPVDRVDPVRDSLGRVTSVDKGLDAEGEDDEDVDAEGEDDEDVDAEGERASHPHPEIDVHGADGGIPEALGGCEGVDAQRLRGLGGFDGAHAEAAESQVPGQLEQESFGGWPEWLQGEAGESQVPGQLEQESFGGLPDWLQVFAAQMTDDMLSSADPEQRYGGATLWIDSYLAGASETSFRPDPSDEP